jgi:hypothetical protein
MKRDLVFYGKILLVTLTPGLLFLIFLLLGDGTTGDDWPILRLYFAFAGYLVVFGMVFIGLRFFFHKVGIWIRK